ncbi:MAG: hypothetical protein HQ471_10505 [Flavobacteriales bacterium]|jgi:hypothetical protein|nr:hypothetical protein [Flavobacteriales bacterium]
MNKNPDYLFSKAQKKVAIAEQELLKPSTDIIPFSICSHSRSAIQLLLESYLIKNNISINENESLALLLERCIVYNPKFKTIDLSNIDCKNNATNSSYCSDINKVSSCLLTAKEIEALIKN